jgi:hypothetical protein
MSAAAPEQARTPKQTERGSSGGAKLPSPCLYGECIGESTRAINMSHLALLGDSTFDNAHYVPGGPSVIDHLRRYLPRGWRATLLAVDGAATADVYRQLAQLPNDATHLAISVGGNNALDHSSLVNDEPSASYAEVLERLADIQSEFRVEYKRLLDEILGYRKPLVVCTVYDAIPILTPPEQIGLCIFNDVILREAFRACVPVIDLRLTCGEQSDFARVSPIEPSAAGGGKIARAVVRVVTEFDFGCESSRVFT